jgi:predicted dithiol-disulfide oxidoreductase (DUF899 family)
MQDNKHAIVSREEWLIARKQLLAREKEFTRTRDALAEQRHGLPWVRIDKSYTFEGARGKVSLGDLFEGRSQLVVYHFMFAPDWEAGCKSCSFWADNFNGITAHLEQRDVTFSAISRAPYAKLRAFAERLGWSFPWVSSFGSDFNFDYDVSFAPEQVANGTATYNYAKADGNPVERPGVSVFCKDAGGALFHAYSCYGRGIDTLNTAYNYLDLVPKGRDEAGLPYPMAWVRYRDEYGR